MKKTVKRVSALAAALLLVLCMLAPILPSGEAYAAGSNGYWELAATNAIKQDASSDSGQSWTYDASEWTHERTYNDERSHLKTRSTTSMLPAKVVPGEAYPLSIFSEYLEMQRTGSNLGSGDQPIARNGFGVYGTDLSGAKIKYESSTGAVNIKYNDSSIGTLTTSGNDKTFTLTKTLSNIVEYTATFPEGKAGDQFTFVFYGFGTSTNTGYSRTIWTYRWVAEKKEEGRWVFKERTHDPLPQNTDDGAGNSVKYSYPEGDDHYIKVIHPDDGNTEFLEYTFRTDISQNMIVEMRAGAERELGAVTNFITFKGRLKGYMDWKDVPDDYIVSVPAKTFFSEIKVSHVRNGSALDQQPAVTETRSTDGKINPKDDISCYHIAPAEIPGLIYRIKGSNYGFMGGRVFSFTVPGGQPGDLLIISLHSYSDQLRTYWTYEWEGEGVVTPGGTTRPDPQPINQNVVTPGDDKPGEDSGTDIISEIVDGFDDPGLPRKAAIAGGGALIAGGAAALINGKDGGGDDGNKKKKKKSGYRMYVNKDFGNMLKRGEAAKYVYARIAELPPGGGEVSRDDLTSKIEVFSGDGVLDVQNGGMTSNGYITAIVKVPEDCTASEGSVSFRFTGEGGVFTRHVVFTLTAAQILFPQENLGLPAGKLKYVKKASGKDSRIGDGSYSMPFAVVGMPKDPKITAEIEIVGATNLSGHYIDKSRIDKPLPYTVATAPDKEYGEKGIYNAVIKEVQDYELEPGITEGFVLRITAEHGAPGDKDYEKAVGELPLYRIHLGLAFTVEAKSIPCYLKLKPGREKKERDKITGEDLEIQFANASLLLLLCDESDMSIIRVPVSPKMDAGGKRPARLKVTPTKVGNDRYCRTGDLNESHQNICNALGITAFPTGQLNENGSHKLKICATEGMMDPPTRMLADIELTAEYDGKTYTAKKNVLLRSQEFRIAQNSDDDRTFLERDKHVTEQLLRISEKIKHEYPLQLFSLADMIDRMLEGFDSRFGYDENQLSNVMNMWTGFLEGSFAGANGTPQGVTFADELAAVYAFMQGLRDNTGFLGRVAMGVMTSGVSEYIFTTMTVAEKMHDAVFKCKGDKDFGFWDGVEIGVTEFGKQILLEVTMGAAIKKFGNTNLGYRIGEKLGDIAAKYRSAIDSADDLLKNNLPLYKQADDALQHCLNFFNSSAKSAKAGIDETLKSADDAAEYGEQLMKKARSELTPEELRALERFEKGLEKGMEKVRRLQKAQQELESITDASKLKEAKANYRKIADEVWTDKNALKALQRVKGEPAARLRAQFNQYRETLLDEVQLEALSDIAKETGIPRDNLYIVNASNGSKLAYKQGKKVPSDRDISFKQKVLSDRTKDLTIDQSLGERAVARRLYKKMNGKEADTIKEAMEFMEGKDVTYVNPEKSAADAIAFEHNLEAYEDLAGMIGIKTDGTMDKSLMKNELHNLQINRAAIEHKGAEWFARSRKTVETAKMLQAEANALSGEAKEALFARVDDLMNQSQGQMVEGVYQITKQVENIITPRGILSTGKCPLSAEAMIIHQQALKVAACEQAPAVFEHFLKKNYNMDMNGYAKYMSQFLN